MAREIIWRPTAEADVAEIGDYLESTASTAVATTVVTKLRAAALRAVDFPYAARMIPEFDDPDRRETFVHEYRLMYRIEAHTISILRVVHGRRLLKNVPGSFEEPGQEGYKAA